MTSARTRAPSIGQVADALNELAPLKLAQSWDNVGLLVGDRRNPCQRVQLCIDCTHPVLEEAIRAEADLIVSYHPPIFKPMSRILADSDQTDSIVFGAASHGIGIYSPHTALDAAEGGTNDVLARLAGLKRTEPFEYVPAASPGYKLVTFVPSEDIEKVSEAIFAAGAGRIGDYQKCSYRLEGQGTFFGSENTNPAIGQRNTLERVSETRLETVVSKARLPEVIAALWDAHPYEEVAYDIYPLEPGLNEGIGRVGTFESAITLKSLAAHLKKATGSTVAMMVGSPATKVNKAAVCVGAAGRLPLEKPRSADCDVIITGEMRHHDALTLLRTGRSAIVLGHWESEKPILPVLRQQLRKRFDQLAVSISKRDRGPFTVVP